MPLTLEASATWSQYVSARGDVELGEGFEENDDEAPGTYVERAVHQGIRLSSEEDPIRELGLTSEGDVVAIWTFLQVDCMRVSDYSGFLEKKRSDAKLKRKLPQKEDAKLDDVPIKKLIVRLPCSFIDARVGPDVEIESFDVVFDTASAHMPRDLSTIKFGTFEKTNASSTLIFTSD